MYKSLYYMATTDNSCFWLVNFLKFFSFETQLPNEQKIGRKHLWKVLYKVSSKQNGRTLTCEKLTDDGRQVMAKAHISIGKVS
jgi:hypothetical protein